MLVGVAKGRYHDDKRVQRTVLPVGQSAKFKVPTLRRCGAPLVVFLESLSTLSNPWRPEDHAYCQ